MAVVVNYRAVKRSFRMLGSAIGSALVGFLQSGSGAVKRPAQDKMREVFSVKDFGAEGDGVADDTAEIQAAVDALGDDGELLFPPGTYKITAPINFTNLDNIKISGYGAAIKATTRFQSYFNFSGCTRVVVDGFAFDQAKTALATYTALDYPNVYNCPVYADGCDGLVVRDCYFWNLYTSSVFFYNSSNMEVASCFFSSPTQTQDQWMQHIHVQSSSGLISIHDNRFENAVPASAAVVPSAVFASGTTGEFVIRNNYTNYCGRDNTGTHRLGVFDFYGNHENVHVIDNVAENCMAQFMRLSAMRNGVVRGNRVNINASAEPSYSTLTIESSITYNGTGQVGCQDIVVEENVFEDLSARASFTVGAISYDWGAPLKNIKICKNSFIGVSRSVYVAGPFSNIAIEDNTSRDGTGAITVEHNGVNAASVTATVGTEANAVFECLSVRRNKGTDSSGGNANALSIILSKTPAFTGTVREFNIEDNKFRAASNNGGQAIAAIIDASVLQGRINIRRNETEKYNYDWYVRSTKEVVVEDNRAISTVTAPYLDDGTNGYVRRRRNQYSTGALSGTATLVAGAVTVSTVEVRTGDTIRVSRLAAGGTLGHLSVGTITNATSFVVNSSSGTDTSVVHWEIEH